MTTKTTPRKPRATKAVAAAAVDPTAVLALLAALGIEVPAGTAQVKARESRAVDVVHNTGAEATKFGAATIKKLTDGEWLPRAGIAAGDLRYVGGKLIAIADEIGA